MLNHSLTMQQVQAQGGPTFPRFGLISGHLHRVVELAGWGKVPKAACSRAAHFSVERKHCFAQLTYHRDYRMCCRGDNSLQQDMGGATSLCTFAGANPLPRNPGERLQL